MEERIRVLIADDQSLYREGLRELMERWPEFAVVGEASNGAEAVLFCDKNAPDIVLMDVKMPTMGGLEATSVIAKAHPEVIVIMLTVEVDDQNLFGAFCNGAKGYVLKDMPSSQLRDCLKEAVRGEPALSGAASKMIIERLVRQLNDASSVSESAQGKGDLNDREVQIFRLVAQGLSNEEIGARLYLSSGTVKKQLRSIMQRYGFENRVQMAAYAIRSGLAD